MGPIQSGSHFKGVKSNNMQATCQEFRPEGCQFVGCWFVKWRVGVIIHRNALMQTKNTDQERA